MTNQHSEMTKQAKKPSTGEPIPYYEIIRRSTTTKTNRERDSRVQTATLLSMLICMALVLSVFLNVYQSITRGGFVFYAQDIRSGNLIKPVPVFADQMSVQPKLGPAPFFSEDQLKKFDGEQKERSVFLNGLYDDMTMAAQLVQINGVRGDEGVILSTVQGPPWAQRRANYKPIELMPNQASPTSLPNTQDTKP